MGAVVEGRQVEYGRSEAFNLTNTPVFGVVSAQANQPRVLQFALRRR